MFTVKAEVWQDVGPNHFQLFQAERVRCCKSRSNATNAPGQPPYIAAELEVELMDNSNSIHETLHVGQGIDHYSAIYVMNEDGKTVEAIRPSNDLRPINIARAA